MDKIEKVNNKWRKEMKKLEDRKMMIAKPIYSENLPEGKGIIKCNKDGIIIMELGSTIKDKNNSHYCNPRHLEDIKKIGNRAYKIFKLLYLQGFFIETFTIDITWKEALVRANLKVLL